ncbi:MAG: FHA domain-containing protein [Atopobiaceae bacterium]
MQPNNNMGATEIFRMPSSDATIPDLMGANVPASPTLTIVKGPSTGKTFQLSGPEVSLGRDPHSDVYLNDMTVSRKHARMDISNVARGVASIEDLGSLNGTWVDGAIVNKALLKDGSTIQIGTFRMVFHTNRRPMRVETGA